MKNYNSLNFHLKNELELQDNDATIIADLFQEETIKKGELLIEQDSFANNLFFLHEGYIRCFTTTPNKEITHWVYWKNRFVTDYPSFRQYRKSPWTYQTLTDCTVHRLSFDDYIKSKDLLLTWDTFENRLLFKLFMALENRIYTFISMNATERYNFLHQAHPNIFNEIPLIYLSSVLNMTPETLSRIRRQLIS